MITASLTSTYEKIIFLLEVLICYLLIRVLCNPKLVFSAFHLDTDMKSLLLSVKFSVYCSRFCMLQCYLIVLLTFIMR